MQNSQNSQQLLYEFQYLKGQRDMFVDQLEFMNASLSNLINTKMTIEKLKDIKEDEEILLPIGGIINLYAKIKNPEKLLFYVSKDVVIEKDLDSSIESLDELIGQHNEQIQYLRNQIQKMDQNLQALSQSFQRANIQQ